MDFKQTNWVYRSPYGSSFTISKMPVYFNHESIQNDGNEEHGTFSIDAFREFDDIYKAEAKVKVEWQRILRENYHHGKQTRNSMRDFSTLEWNISGKEDKWHLSHDLTSFIGKKQEVLKKRLYIQYMMHAIVYCDQKQVLYQINCTVIERFYQNYKPLFIELIDSFVCHE
jgi:hypothetical protein